MELLMEEKHTNGFPISSENWKLYLNRMLSNEERCRRVGYTRAAAFPRKLGTSQLSDSFVQWEESQHALVAPHTSSEQQVMSINALIRFWPITLLVEMNVNSRRQGQLSSERTEQSQMLAPKYVIAASSMEDGPQPG